MRNTGLNIVLVISKSDLERHFESKVVRERKIIARYFACEHYLCVSRSQRVEMSAVGMSGVRVTEKDIVEPFSLASSGDRVERLAGRVGIEGRVGRDAVLAEGLLW